MPSLALRGNSNLLSGGMYMHEAVPQPWVCIVAKEETRLVVVGISVIGDLIVKAVWYRPFS